MVELLAPAGSYESLRAAVNAGADAVYIGGSMFGARAYAENPDEEGLIKGIEYCHIHGRKLYMTVNTLLKERELQQMLYPFLLPFYENGLDGLIVQDLGVVQFVQKHFPDIEIHGSTQMTVTGPAGAEFLKKQGLTRVVPARELSLAEIKAIIEETGLEVETFIHGAMCYCYSGQCLFSSMLGGRSGNRGRCAQPCRLPYTVLPEKGYEKQRPGSTVQNGSRKKTSGYLLSMKDMCTLDILPELLDAGISSLKIEGRMKRPEYTAGVVSVYRKYIDLYETAGKKKYRVEEEDRRILQDLYNRGGFSEGYYHMHNGKTMMSLTRPNHQGTPAARIKNTDKGKKMAVALEDLHKKDILELDSNKSITISGDIKEGDVFPVASGGVRLDAGMTLYRTKNEFLLDSLQERFVKGECKEKIKGELRITHDFPAILKVQLGDVSVEEKMNVAQPALNNPTSEETIYRQMCKTGNTPFVFEELSVFSEDGLFVPMAAINEFRRKTLELLRVTILERFRRTEAEKKKTDNERTDNERTGIREDDPAGSDGSQGSFKMNVLVTTREQLQVLERIDASFIDTVYLDTFLLGMIDELETTCICIIKSIRRMKNRGWRCFLNCPPVLRKKDRDFLSDKSVLQVIDEMDGFLLHTIDELGYFQNLLKQGNPDRILAADDNLYAYNRTAVSFLEKQGIRRFTLPAELNCHELMDLPAKRAELIVYGRQPLMQSAQCVKKNTSECSRTPGILYLRDRKKAEFPVINRCAVCCNTIYNSVPLHLGECQKEIRSLSPAFVRLSFTVETGRETERILKMYERLLFGEEGGADEKTEGTRGHFKRGVE